LEISLAVRGDTVLTGGYIGAMEAVRAGPQKLADQLLE